jgi:hypothetical protein
MNKTIRFKREQLGSGAIADGETRAKNASGNGPLTLIVTGTLKLTF